MTRLTASPMIRVAVICRRPELPRQPGPKRRRRLTLMMRAVLYALRGGFLVRPLAIALVLGATGMLFSEFEEAFPPLDAWVPLLMEASPRKTDRTAPKGLALSAKCTTASANCLDPFCPGDIRWRLRSRP